jgi:hypothetical protein
MSHLGFRLIRRIFAVALAGAPLLVAACNAPPARDADVDRTSAAPPPAASDAGSMDVHLVISPADAGTVDAAPSASLASTRAPATGSAAEATLFVDTPGSSEAAARATACAPDLPPTARTTCLIDLRYATDPAAQAVAHDLYTRYGILAGLGPKHSESMGWRGVVHFVPQLPTGDAERHHLAWMGAAMHDFEALFAALDPERTHHVRYEFHPFVLRYLRSVGRHTPSAYADPERWEISYNLAGSLNTSETRVRELVFHELFHRNDSDDNGWSVRVLAPVFRRIVAKCGRREACLAPYAPTETKVRGGTFYAFQPADYDEVIEYAAELAIRWYREQRAMVHGEAVKAPFKCTTPENGEAWRLVTSEFFDGIDRVPACATPAP